MRALFIALLLLLAAPSLLAQPRLIEWTEQGGELPLGYPVPIPVDTDLPFDGFRTYSGLRLRHQTLASSGWAHEMQLGSTHNGRPIWIYQMGDADLSTPFGFPEHAMLTNGGIHAREWQTPEVVTGIMELLVEQQDDQHLYRYLLENANILLIPVLNVDGFLQTQRTPSQNWFGTDPFDGPTPSSPRDGRMRRKNMRSVDENINTQNDHLGGIDLNRNNPPFWATSGSSSSDSRSLIYHGGQPHSEAETQALAAAAALGPGNKLTMYTDVHSFSQVHFWTRVHQRQATNARNLLTLFSDHHASFPAGKYYAFTPSTSAGIGFGIGTTDEYFAYTYQVPSWTLEIEPSNLYANPSQDPHPNLPGCGADYGGVARNCHDGFVLPESQIRRVREQLAQTFAVSYYRQSGPPSVATVRIFDAASNAMVYEAAWNRSNNAARQLYQWQPAPLALATDYKLWVAFDKPMRWRQGGQVAPLPGTANTLPVNLATSVEGSNFFALQGEPQWQQEEGSYLRYRDDAFVMDLRLPATTANTALLEGQEMVEVDLALTLTDMVGMALDARPQTPARWASGGWFDYEDNAGNNISDTGGTDRSLSFQLSATPAAMPFSMQNGISGAWRDPARIGEGFLIEILGDDLAGVYWFTYDSEGNQAWYTGVGSIAGNRLVVDELVRTYGGRFGPDFDPDEVVREVVGTISIAFESCGSGTVAWHVDNQRGHQDIERLTRVMGTECGNYLGPPVRQEAGLSGSWYELATRGQGFNLEILDSGAVGMYWFTYDSEGNQAWLFGVGVIDDGALVFDDVYSTSGPSFGAAFDPDDVELQNWGSLRFEISCDGGPLLWDSDLPEFGSGSLDLTRLTFLAGLDCSD